MAENQTIFEQAVFEYAKVTAQMALGALSIAGEDAGYAQCIDSAPEQGGHACEFTDRKLDRAAGHQMIEDRLAGGFRGIASFACFEPPKRRIYAEALDSRPDAAREMEGPRSVAVVIPLKKNWRGKWVGIIDGAAVLGVGN